MTRAELKQHARDSLSGHWGVAVGVLLLQSLINGGCNSLLSIELVPPESNAVSSYIASGLQNVSIEYGGVTLEPFTLLVSFVLSVGVCSVYLKLVRGETPEWTDLFDGFRLCLLHAVLAGLLIAAITDVGYLLLIIPGIIVSLGFSQTAYILRDQPELTCIDAMRASWELMTGHKLELFVLGLSFIGWDLLCVLILPALYVLPYQQATYAAYYDSLTGRLGREDTTYCCDSFTDDKA